MAKKYASDSTLSALVAKIKELFATKSDVNTALSGKADSSHTHTISNVTNLQTTLDSKVPTTRTINNKPLSSNITLSASDVGAAPSSVQTNLNTVSDTLNAHTENDDIHFSAAERTKLSGIAAGAQVNTITGVKGNSESTYRTGNVNITKANIGLGNVDNTSDANKPVSTAQQGAIDASLTSANEYTDTAISNLINSAPTTLDTLGEIATAMEENADVVEALEASIGTKANASDLTSHTSNKSNPHGVTLAQLGVTATAAELNIMDGVTATTAEINKLDGLTATTAELNYMDGVTSNVQTQLDGKSSTSHEHSASKITSGILAIEQGGTGNSNGLVQSGALDGTTVGALSTAEGRNVTVSGDYSHAEGNYTEATGFCSHAEGQTTFASGSMSHAEGEYTEASGKRSHAEGDHTIAASDASHAQGKYNIADEDGVYAHIVGNGTSMKRSNAHTLDWDGNAWFAGDVYVGGTSQTSGATMLSSIATVSTAEYTALEEAQATNANTLYMLTDADEGEAYLPLSGGTMTGILYTNASTPLFIGKNGKVGMRASTDTQNNVGQINVSNAWYDTGNQWGAQISAYNGETGGYNELRISHNGIEYNCEDGNTYQVALTKDVDSLSEKIVDEINGLNIPSDDYINSLIDAKLGVIENGSY